jgi:hypothetical protein
MSAVVLKHTTVGYTNYQPAGRFWEARSAAPNAVIGAFPSAHEARQAIFADRRARQAELKRNRPRHPPGTKPVFRGERLIGWISTSDGGFDAVLADGEVRGPFATESAARKEINSSRGKSRSKLPGVYGLAARRRAELVHLALHRNAQGQMIEVKAMAMVMADALAFAMTGADYAAMCELARACNLGLAENDIMFAVRKVSAVAKAKGRAYRPFAARAVARMLGVTLAEKKLLNLRTVGAVDETKEQAEERRRTQRREYERERNRRRRLERGAVPREKSLSQTQPWKDTGVSRSTWYERQRKAQEAERSEMTASSGREPAIGQIRPPAIQGKGFASAVVEPVQHHGPRRDGRAVECEGHTAEVIDLGRVFHSDRPPTGRPTGTEAASGTRQAGDAPPYAESKVAGAPDFNGYSLALLRAHPRGYDKSLRALDNQYAQMHPEIAKREFRETRLAIYNAHLGRVKRTISEKAFAEQLSKVGVFLASLGPH